MFGQKTEIFQGKECALYDTAVAYTGQHAFLKSHIQHQKGVLIQAVDLKQQCALMGFTALVTLFIPVADTWENRMPYRRRDSFSHGFRGPVERVTVPPHLMGQAER